MTVGGNPIYDTVNALKQAAPSGFAVALHINFTTPRLLFQTYSEEWIKYYSENGLVMSDPTVLWGFENDGTRRWSELAPLDTAGVLEKAAEYGMKFGVTCAVSDEGTRSIGSFSHHAAEFDDAVINKLHEQMLTLHKLTQSPGAITPKLTGALYDINVQIQAN